MEDGESKRVRRQRARKEKAESARKNLAGKIVFRIVVAVAALCILGGAAWFGGKAILKVTETQKYARLEQELLNCAELVSVKMRYSEIVSLKRSGAGGLARSYSIIRFTGIVRAGIADISKARIVVGSDGDKSRVAVVLPKTEILGNEILSQEVYDEQQSIFRSVRITTDEIFGGINSARLDTEKKLIGEGILDEAATHACTVVSSFLRGAGFENVTVYIGKQKNEG